MFAVASLLDQESDLLVKSIWDELDVCCGLAGIKKSPMPHFSWQIAEEYDFIETEKQLQRHAKTYSQIRMKISGIGIFTGDTPVLYLALINKIEAINRHKDLWNQLNKYARSPSMLYQPGSWVPHITIAYGDTDPEKLASAVNSLALAKFEKEIILSDIVLAYFKDDVIGVHSNYQLAGKKA